MEQVRVAIVYYSATGSVLSLAQAAAHGAEEAGALVRLRKVAELAPPEAVQSNPQWAATAEAMWEIPEASTADLEWADAVLFGTPTRYGLVASQLKQFIDATGPLWQEGKLANKVYGAFTSAATAHGGHESTLLSLANVFYHWGGVIVPPGYNDPIQFQTGNPYGTSHLAADGGPGEPELAAAAFQARRVVHSAAALKHGRLQLQIMEDRELSAQA